MTALLVSDARTWEATRKNDPKKSGQLLGWLAANGIDPREASSDHPITIENDGTRPVIRYTVYLRNAAGRIYEDPATNNAACEERATPLTVPLPDTWPQRVGPVTPKPTP